MVNASELYKEQRFGERIGFGERPVLILVDFIRGCTDPAISKIGFDQTEELEKSQKLLTIFREKKLPVVHTTVVYSEGAVDGGWFVKKIPALQRNLKNTPYVEFDERVKPLPNEPVIEKKFASVFFGTNMQSLLTSLCVDTVILVGNSTSGCIRASAVDACSYGYRTILVEECVSDRTEEIHRASLFDIDSKYADVVSIENVINYLNGR